MSNVMYRCSPRAPAHYHKLISRGFEELGSGCYATVVAKPKSQYVIKLGPKDDGWLKFHTYTLDRPNIYFPKIKRVVHVEDFYVAVIERLDRTAAEAGRSDWWSEIRAHDFDDPEFPGLLETIEDLRHHARTNNLHMDLHDDNVMLRKDNSVVITDPFR